MNGLTKSFLGVFTTAFLVAGFSVIALTVFGSLLIPLLVFDLFCLPAKVLDKWRASH